MTENAYEALTQRAFMDTSWGTVGFDVVRVPLPSFAGATGSPRQTTTEKQFYSGGLQEDRPDGMNDESEYKGRTDNKRNLFEDDYLYVGDNIYSRKWGGDPIETINPFKETYSLIGNNTPDELKKVYSEWGMPRNALDEQWYIAMKWPYNPDKEKDPLMYAKFQSKAGKYGTVADYKNRKVLVYSPATNTAVCLRPAYYLWGGSGDENKLLDINAAEKPDAQFSFDLDNQASADQTVGDVFVDAVVSPDAAFYLGVLTSTNLTDNDDGSYHYGLQRSGTAVWDKGAMETSDNVDTIGGLRAIATVAFGYQGDQRNQLWRLTSNGKSTEQAAAYAGFNVAPVSRPCYFTFVEDDFPLGVVPADLINNTYYNYKSANDPGGKWLSENNYIIGFGAPEGFKDDQVYATYNDANSLEYTESDFNEDLVTSTGYMKELLENPPGNNNAIELEMFVPPKKIAVYNEGKEVFESTLGGNNLNYFTYIIRQPVMSQPTLRNLQRKVCLKITKKKEENFTKMYMIPLVVQEYLEHLEQIMMSNTMFRHV